MTTPDQRADNSARSAAIKLVDQALKSGRIVQADHDMRVDQLRQAQTMQDIDLQTRDLVAAAPVAPTTIAPMAPTPTGQSTPSATPGAGGQPWPLVNYGTPSPGPGLSSTTTSSKGGKAIGGLVAAIVLVAVIVPIAGAIIAFVSARNSLPDFGDLGPTDETTYAPGQTPGKHGVNLHTVDGYNGLVSAIRKESNGPYVYNAVIYPRYAVIELPTGTNNRYEDFYYNGDKLSLEDIKGTTDDPQVDLSLIDPQMMIDLLNQVRGEVDNPDTWYVYIADDTGQGGTITAYANNEFSESAYIEEKFDGTVVYDSTKQGG